MTTTTTVRRRALCGVSRMEGRVALVTGASSGIGASCARLLAASGLDVVAVARREPELNALCRELTDAHGVRATAVVADLSVPGSASVAYCEAVAALGPIHVLVNNAGAGIHAAFTDVDLAHHRRLLELDIAAVTELTLLGARQMRASGGGYILNVASLGAHLPVPGYAIYAAAKAYVRSFSLALAHELAGTGVRVCALSPGGTATGFFDAAGQTVGRRLRWALMDADRCARIGLRGLFRGRRDVVPGWTNALGALLLRGVPTRIATALAARIMGAPAARRWTTLADGRDDLPDATISRDRSTARTRGST